MADLIAKARARFDNGIITYDQYRATIAAILSGAADVNAA